MLSCIRRLACLLLLCLPGVARPQALPAAPVNLQDLASLQRGAQVFTQYCLNCHALSLMRYQQLSDIGMSSAAIQKLLPAGKQPGDSMQAALDPALAAKAFGRTPPDLSLEARARGAAWLYAYLRGFYRDDTQPSGWNNIVFDKVMMPHVLASEQGEQQLRVVRAPDGPPVRQLQLITPGSMSRISHGVADTRAFDQQMADLTGFMLYCAEPAARVRHQLGYWVLGFLILIFCPLVYWLKREYWRDIR